MSKQDLARFNSYLMEAIIGYYNSSCTFVCVDSDQRAPLYTKYHVIEDNFIPKLWPYPIPILPGLEYVCGACITRWQFVQPTGFCKVIAAGMVERDNNVVVLWAIEYQCAVQCSISPPVVWSSSSCALTPAHAKLQTYQIEREQCRAINQRLQKATYVWLIRLLRCWILMNEWIVEDLLEQWFEVKRFSYGINPL